MMTAFEFSKKNILLKKIILDNHENRDKLKDKEFNDNIELNIKKYLGNL